MPHSEDSQLRHVRLCVLILIAKGELMFWRSSVAVAGLAAVVVGGALAPARAQNAREAELVGFHQLCDKGDRRACVRFGMMLGQNQERHAEWRRLHPEWWWWER
jgi:hypothetical protein